MIATFHHREFTDRRALRRAKLEQGVRISCVIPTLDEVGTIVGVVAAMKRSQIVDEVVVVDSGSSDGTREAARAAGAEVFLADEIRPDLGPAVGKGENLWKSLHVVSGDIVVFVDGDLRRPHPRIVDGLAGPLLAHPGLRYVKAFYERPGAGGRVTELLVKPLLRQLFPELAALRQPLAGEYAARRAFLESLTFPCDYSVEAAHLIDIATRHGTGVLAQTDLVSRLHRERPLHELTVMCDAIVQRVFHRLHALGRWPDPVMAGAERPPISELPPHPKTQRPSKDRRGVRRR